MKLPMPSRSRNIALGRIDVSSLRNDALSQLQPIADADQLRQLVDPTWLVEDRDKLVARLAGSGCILDGHFELQSLQHSKTFIQFSNFSRFAANLSWASRILAEKMRQSGLRFNSIVGPTTAGNRLALALNDSMFGVGDHVYTIEADLAGRPTSRFVGEVVRAGDMVLLVSDVLTTGAGLRKMRVAIEEAGATVASVALFASRTADPASKLGDPQLPVFWLFTLKAEEYGEPGFEDNAKNCPLCHYGAGDATPPVPARQLN
jgi:orotate phosphoribosyltransferase